MSYQALARKWRPSTFATMVGQEHTLNTLTHSLDNDRLHHAYLFTGSRGVGKTTVARIFAKCLNCKQGISSQPCGQCAACTDIDLGKFIDLLEIDAASRTKVEDTRELLENVIYSPTSGRYKIYLIDEVHMLSAHSFNALLKTLEEPPSHVKFLLATTDPHKLPVTVLSRCLQLHLKNLIPELIASHLKTILQEETVEYEDQAIAELARSADGSMRDALSLAEQAIAQGAGKLGVDTVRSMLGSIDQCKVSDLLQALIEKDGQGLLKMIDELAPYAPDYLTIIDELVQLLHQIAVVQQTGKQFGSWFMEADTVEALAKDERLPSTLVQVYYQMGIMGRRDISLAPSMRIGFEMVMLRMLSFQLLSTKALLEPKASPSTSESHTNRGDPAAAEADTQGSEAREEATPKAPKISPAAADKVATPKAPKVSPATADKEAAPKATKESPDADKEAAPKATKESPANTDKEATTENNQEEANQSSKSLSTEGTKEQQQELAQLLANPRIQILIDGGAEIDKDSIKSN